MRHILNNSNRKTMLSSLIGGTMKRILLVLISVCYGLNFTASAQHDLYGLWSRKAGVITPGANISVYQTLIDSKGSVYVCGHFVGTVSLSDNTCDLIMSRQNGESEWTDGFVSKYDASGNFLWTVMLATNSLDRIPGMVLSPDEQTLTIMAYYGNHAYSSPIVTPGNCEVIYGDGTVETLTYNQPWNTFANYSIVFINSIDGTQKKQATYLGYAIQNVDFFYVDHFSGDAAGNLYAIGEGGSNPRYYRVRKYDNTGTLLSTDNVHSSSNSDIHSSYVSKNLHADHLYMLMYTPPAVVTSDRYLYVYKVNRANPSSHSSLSHISTTTYPARGIYDMGIDVNNDETHLFVAGYTNANFTYQSTGANITNAGGKDGIIVCYDPQDPNGATNMRWMVNLRTVGDQSFTDCQFDEATQSLHVVGYIDAHPVDFNPRGTAMMYQSTVDTAMFYAVYDMTGICQKVEIMNSNGNDAAQSISLSGDNIAIFGTFSGSPFQPDPSGRVRPLRTSTKSAFLSKYSTDPASVPAPARLASYSSANNVKASYGMAIHEIMGCLRLGNLNNAIDGFSASIYVPQNVPGVTGGNPNHDGLQSIQINTPSGGMTVVMNALNSKNSPAYMAGWIDFNGNGMFDPGEVSAIVTVPANTNVLTACSLVWTSFPTVTKAKLETMLRVRLTSETLDGTWATDFASDGEVEDYTLSLDLLDASKTVAITNSHFSVGDTITYTVSVTSQVNATVTVFDPIPDHSAYVSGSANPAGGALATVTLQGQTMDAIRWTPVTLVAGIPQTFSFKATVTGYPASNHISNVGYIVMNGDSIPTTGSSCDLATVWRMMSKDATLFITSTDSVVHNGFFANPVSVLFGDTIKYRIEAINATPITQIVEIIDTLPAYLDYVSGSSNHPVIDSPAGVSRTRLMWSVNTAPDDTAVVTFRTSPREGVNASQPLFGNRAWITIDGRTFPTNFTWHQGAGVSQVTFSASHGGKIYHAVEQALDYRTSPRSGIVVVPDEGYVFTGWSHADYISLRGQIIPAQSGVMQYDTLIVYGNVELHADFVPEVYSITCHLNGGHFPDPANSPFSMLHAQFPTAYTIESQDITFGAPEKTDDMFIGWTGANGDEPQPTVTIPSHSTGDRVYYANYLHSGRAIDIQQADIPADDRIWAFENELYVHTSKPGSILRIYSLEGILLRQQIILQTGETKYRLANGIYVVTLNNGIGQKIMVND